MNAETKSPSDTKKAYSSPRLVSYGEVRALTQTGGTMSGENNMGNDLKKSSSDRHLKENIVQIGTHPLGIGLYLFDYKSEFQSECGFGRQFGVMADEVETVVPTAVSLHLNGYKAVDYSQLGIHRTVH